MSMDEAENEGTDGESSAGRGSPLPGCVILALIVTVFGGLVILYTVVGIYQHRSIATFTEETAAPVTITPPAPEAVEAAQAKLEQIAAAVSEGRSERVLFSADDLNALVVSLEAASGFRENTRVQSISPEGLVVAMAQPVRRGLFEKGFRYLNGDFVLEPELRARTIAFRLVAIRPAVGEVPPAFVGSYASLDLFRLDPANPALEANVPSLAAVYIEDGHLVVETKVGGPGTE
jgi:hypothetical protein